MTPPPPDPDITASAEAAPAPGRPDEIELWSNLRVIHPVSKAIARALARTPVTPNMVSISGAVSAAAAAASYTLLPWPASAFAGFGFHILWHVLDGADGALARLTGRSSPVGEIVDGICDYFGRITLYVSLALFGAWQFGPWVLALAAVTGACRVAQINTYETLRRNYRRYVYGADWIRQSLDTPAAVKPGGPAAVQRGLARLFLAISVRVTPDDSALEAAVAARLARDPGADEAVRALCRRELLGPIKTASPLATNQESVVVFLSMLAGSPLWLFAYVLVVLNAGYVRVYLVERAALRRLTAALAA